MFRLSENPAPATEQKHTFDQLTQPTIIRRRCFGIRNGDKDELKLRTNTQAVGLKQLSRKFEIDFRSGRTN